MASYMRIGRLKIAVAIVLVSGISARAGGFSLWPFEMRITFPGYDRPETLTNFPALVVLGTNIEGFSYTQFGGDSTNLRFASSNGATELNYEVEQWDTNGNSYVWVQVPQIEGTNTGIFAYWGSPNGTNPPLPSYTTNGATWSEGFSAVWHMTDVNARDSSGNSNHGTAQGTGIWSTTGRVGPANGFPGSSTQDFILVNHSVSLDLTSAVTVEAWVYDTTGTSDARGIVSKRNVQQAYLVFLWSSRKFNGRIGGTGGAGDTSLPTNQWCCVGMTYDSTVTNTQRKVLYFNGSTDGVRLDNNEFIPSRTVTVNIGTLEPQYWCQWKGMIDEARISSVARSSNWMWACYVNQASNEWFNAYGGVVRRTAEGAVLTIR